MASKIPHFNEKDLMPLGQKLFVWRETCTIGNGEIQCSGGVERYKDKTEHELVIQKSKTERENIKTKFEAKNISATDTVKKCITDKKEFDVEAFGTDPIITSLIKEVTNKDKNEELTEAELQKIIKLYPERAIKIRLTKIGQWGNFLNSCRDYKDILSEYWDPTKISQDFHNSKNSAMTLAGASYGLSVLFGLGGEDSTWYKELTNASAYKRSGSKMWKLAMAALIGGEVGGLKILETAGLGVRAYFNGLGQLSYTAAALISNLLNPEAMKRILAGESIEKVVSKEDLENFMPILKGYLNPNMEAIFGRFYEKETGKNFELTPKQINTVAHLTVLLSDSLITDGELDTLDTNLSKRAQLQNLTDMAALSLARHPDKNIRDQFEKAVNDEITKRKDLKAQSKFVPLFKKIKDPKTGKMIEVGEITKIMNNKKFDKDFERGAKQLLSRMTKNERKSILQMATSHGLSGLLIMAWVFLQGTFLLTSTVFSVGGKLLEKKEKKEKPSPASENADKAKNLLQIETKDLKKDDWKNLLDALVIAGVITKKVSKNLKKKKEEVYKAIFDEIRTGNKNDFNIGDTSNIKEIAKMQKAFKTATEKAGVKINLVPLGELGKRKKYLKKLHKFHADLVKFQSTIGKNYNFGTNGILGTLKNYIGDTKLFAKKRGAEISKRLKLLLSGKAFTTGKANAIFSNLGVPAGPLKEIADTNKGDGLRLNEIIKLSKSVLDVYDHDDGKTILDGLKK